MTTGNKASEPGMHCSLVGHRWVLYGDCSQQCSVCKLMIAPDAALALLKKKRATDAYTNSLAVAAAAHAFENQNALLPTTIIIPGTATLRGDDPAADADEDAALRDVIGWLTFFVLGLASALGGIWLASVLVP